MADSDAPELDELLFYQQLTSTFSELYSKAQDTCSFIIIPQTITDPQILTRDVVESHLFRPSPYFIQKHLSCNDKYEIELDNNRTIRIVDKKEGSSEKRIKVLGQEDVRDTSRNRKYSILIVEQLIIDVSTLKQNANGASNKLQDKRQLSQEQKFNPLAASYETSFMYLDSLRQVEPAFARLRTQLFLFNETYVILPKYVENALEKLREQRTQFLNDSYQLLNRTSEDREIEVASEIYITGNIYTKVWPVLIQHNEEKDQQLHANILKRNRKHLSKSIDIHSSKNLTALNELKKLVDLKSAYEKAKCIRSALDLTMAAKSMMTVDPQHASVSYHAGASATPMAADETLTAFIDVICQLGAQSDTGEFSRLYAHAFYIEKFRFLPLPQDIDYAFTTYQGVLEYLSNNTSWF